VAGAGAYQLLIQASRHLALPKGVDASTVMLVTAAERALAGHEDATLKLSSKRRSAIGSMGGAANIVSMSSMMKTTEVRAQDNEAAFSIKSALWRMLESFAIVGPGTAP
jgi:hypothetical protein